MISLSLSPSAGVSFNSVYTQIWRVLLHLAADPFPEVSDLAMKVLNSIAYKVHSVTSSSCNLLPLGHDLEEIYFSGV